MFKLNTVQYKMAPKNVRWRHNFNWCHVRNTKTSFYSSGNFGNNSYAYNEAADVCLNSLHLQKLKIWAGAKRVVVIMDAIFLVIFQIRHEQLYITYSILVSTNLPNFIRMRPCHRNIARAPYAVTLSVDAVVGMSPFQHHSN